MYIKVNKMGRPDPVDKHVPCTIPSTNTKSIHLIYIFLNTLKPMIYGNRHHYCSHFLEKR